MAHKQRGITNRCEATANIADDKDKEDRDVGYELPFAIRPQNRSDQKHCGSCCSENIGYNPANKKEDRIISGSRCNISAQEYPPRDNKKRGE